MSNFASRKYEGVIFPDSSCMDIGTPEDLIKAVRSETNLRQPA